MKWQEIPQLKNDRLERKEAKRNMCRKTHRQTSKKNVVKELKKHVIWGLWVQKNNIKSGWKEKIREIKSLEIIKWNQWIFSAVFLFFLPYNHNSRNLVEFLSVLNV